MAAPAWVTGLAAWIVGIGVGMAAAGTASAQNYDGSTLIRFGAFAQGAFLNYGVTQPVIGSASGDGVSGGLSAGIDYHPNPYWLLGVEMDASMGDTRANFNNTGYGLDYLATLRGRFGVYARPDFLLYGTAGLALLGLEVQQTGTGSKAMETLSGTIVGGGAELTWNHVILFGEYDYANFGSRQFNIAGVRQETDADAHLMRFGIKFKVGHDHSHDVGRYYEPLK